MDALYDMHSSRNFVVSFDMRVYVRLSSLNSSSMVPSAKPVFSLTICGRRQNAFCIPFLKMNKHVMVNDDTSSCFEKIGPRQDAQPTAGVLKRIHAIFITR